MYYYRSIGHIRVTFLIIAEIGKFSAKIDFNSSPMDNIQQISDAVQKGLRLIMRASIQQGNTRLRRLRIEYIVILFTLC